MFGLKSSPFNALRALRQCAKDQEKNFPNAAKIIETSFYIDDGIFGFNTHQGNFPLKNWASSAKEVEEHMNSPSTTAVIIGNDETKILGLIWLKTSDEWAILVRQLEIQSKPTKRSILRQMANLTKHRSKRDE